jgi:hypothetical protein
MAKVARGVPRGAGGDRSSSPSRPTRPTRAGHLPARYRAMMTGRMHALRIAMTLLVILVWGLFVPFAMAADHCAAMGSMCEGPCGASSTATAPAVPGYTVLVSRAPSMPAPAVPQSDRSTLEPPPKLLVHSA